jgi:adenine-specific DNA-methyltransferase
LQTREIVLSNKDTNSDELFDSENLINAHNTLLDAMNRLIYGDNLLAMAALLSGA